MTCGAHFDCAAYVHELVTAWYGKPRVRRTPDVIKAERQAKVARREFYAKRRAERRATNARV